MGPLEALGVLFGLALAQKMMTGANALFMGDGRHLEDDDEYDDETEGELDEEPSEEGVRFQGTKPRQIPRKEGNVIYLPPRAKKVRK